jgi:uncharacterized membrane protein YcjF (UPF0283 family)
MRFEDVGGWTILKWILKRWDGVDWIYVAQDRDKWRALVNTVLNQVLEWLHNWRLHKKSQLRR